ncbi:MAG: hypothetical protein LBF58_02380 [Deltaproteobacteria bacterium]|jgi:lipopolysaccharide export system protein LptA|nr:hypothetical protein [Deltaproteobacteria bacterium]
MIKKFIFIILVLCLYQVDTNQVLAVETPLGNSSGPISISADRMTSDDNTRIVTFIGRVITRQDDLIITCDLMRVHYQPTGEQAGPAEGQPGAQTGQAGPAVTVGQAMEPGGPPATGPGAAPPLTPAAGPPRQPARTDERAPAGQSGMPGPLEGGQEIYRIECEGSVKIQQRDRLAVGQKALYLAKSEPRRLILTGDARVWEAGNSVTGHQVIYYLDQNRSQVESRQNQRVRAFYDEGANQ